MACPPQRAGLAYLSANDSLANPLGLQNPVLAQRCTRHKCKPLREERKDVPQKMHFGLDVLDFALHFKRKMDPVSDT